MVFGNKQKDMSQDERIANVEKWIEALNKNQVVLIKNNDWFIQAIQALQQKDKEHDARDLEHDKLIEHLKELGKAVEETTK